MEAANAEEAADDGESTAGDANMQGPAVELNGEPKNTAKKN